MMALLSLLVHSYWRCLFAYAYVVFIFRHLQGLGNALEL